jgi:hypothetical protein
VSGQDHDEAWRAIVENYGDRPALDDEPPAPSEPQPASAMPETDEPAEDPEDAEEVAERFVPPVPPPGPSLRLPDHLPWLGVLGSPALLLVATLAGIDLPGWAGYALVAAFLGGFVWLVATMRRGGGRDPWDDGARV